MKKRIQVEKIIFFLREKNLNSVITSCSSTHSGLNSNNVLQNNNLIFHSQNVPNSWIMIQFSLAKILISGYILRSRYDSDGHHPQNWTLEGLVDDNQWNLLDSKTNQTCLCGLNKEVFFSCDGKDYFSHFKFTQTGQNSSNCNYFTIAYIEFSGHILS